MSPPLDLGGGEVVRLADERGWFAARRLRIDEPDRRPPAHAEDEPSTRSSSSAAGAGDLASRNRPPGSRAPGRCTAVHGERICCPAGRRSLCRLHDAADVDRGTDARRDLFADCCSGCSPRARSWNATTCGSGRTKVSSSARECCAAATPPGRVPQARSSSSPNLLAGRRRRISRSGRNRIEPDAMRAAARWTASPTAAPSRCSWPAARRRSSPWTSATRPRPGREAAAHNGAHNVGSGGECVRSAAAPRARAASLRHHRPRSSRVREDENIDRCGAARVQEINLRAFHLLSPRVLVTNSCSFHVDEACSNARPAGGVDARRSVQVIERRGRRRPPTLLGVLRRATSNASSCGAVTDESSTRASAGRSRPRCAGRRRADRGDRGVASGRNGSSEHHRDGARAEEREALRLQDGARAGDCDARTRARSPGRHRCSLLERQQLVADRASAFSEEEHDARASHARTGRGWPWSRRAGPCGR